MSTHLCPRIVFGWKTTIAVLLLFIVFPEKLNAISENVKVGIIAVNCGQDWTEVPSLSLVGADPATTPKELSPGVYRFDVTIPAGSYVLSVSTRHHGSSRPGGCTGMASFTLLGGHDRHLIVPMQEGLTINDADCSIAGTLPVEGLGIGLVRPSGGETPAIIDGGAYYFDNLIPRRYAIRIRFSTGTHSDIPVDLSNPDSPHGVICGGKNASDNRLHDISLSELTQLSRVSTYSFGDNATAELTGRQTKALIVAYSDILQKKIAPTTPIERLKVNVTTTDQSYQVAFYVRRHDGTLTGGGIVEILDAATYRIKERQSYCPGRAVSTSLPPC